LTLALRRPAQTALNEIFFVQKPWVLAIDELVFRLSARGGIIPKVRSFQMQYNAIMLPVVAKKNKKYGAANGMLLYSLPILCSEKGAQVSAYDQCIRVAGLEPVFEFVPFPFFGKQDPPALPATINERHILNNDHAEHGFIFAFVFAFIAEMVDAFPHHFDDFAELRAVFFKNMDMAFLLSGFVVNSRPGTQWKGLTSGNLCKNEV
jgi:hypothetical protein